MKNKKFTYRKTRNAVLIAMVIGLVLMFVAGFALETRSLSQEIVATVGVVLFFAALAIVLVAFRCPVCGFGFVKSALFIAKCPNCGFEFADFELFKKIHNPEWSSRRNDSHERINKHD